MSGDLFDSLTCRCLCLVCGEWWEVDKFGDATEVTPNGHGYGKPCPHPVLISDDEWMRRLKSNGLDDA